jgi:adenylate kinase family enzyme
MTIFRRLRPLFYNREREDAVNEDPVTESSPGTDEGTPAQEPASVQPPIEREYQQPTSRDQDPDPTTNVEPQVSRGPDPDPTPYETNRQYLYDELRRTDRLVRAATVRWQHFLTQHKDPLDWGMLRVDQSEVFAYLQAPWLAPGEVPASVQQELQSYWHDVQSTAEWIEARLALTTGEVRSNLRLYELCRQLKLSAFERDVLSICLLPELDERYRRLFGYLQDDASRTQPTVELVLNILPPHLYPEGEIAGRRAAFAPQGRLLAHHLLVMGGEDRGNEALSVRSLRLDDRIQRFLLGDDLFDQRLMGTLALYDNACCWTLGDPSSGQRQLIVNEDELGELTRLADWLREYSHDRVTIFLHGPYGNSRRARAAYLCCQQKVPLLVYDVPTGLASGTDWKLLVDLAYREAALRGAALYWHRCEALLAENSAEMNGANGWQALLTGSAPETKWRILLDAVELYGGLSFLASEVAWEPADRFRETRYLHLDCQAPDYPTRQRLWYRYLQDEQVTLSSGATHRTVTQELANDFVFTAGQMEDALTSARSIRLERRDGVSPSTSAQAQPNKGGPTLTLADIYEGCRRQASRHVVTMAQRIRPRPDLKLDDVVLPAANRLQLREVFQRDHHRSRLYSDLQFGRQLRLGKGLVVLFTGTSGTGKTLAAEALASQRQVDLYQVDLASVVSKWVGETEKNIDKVFAEVEGANAILFFDEADALFGKRAEVKDAQDRWANMEVNYLLQRIEAYSGTVILASNLRQNIDEAFLRRIHMVVDFPFPDKELRRRIFQVTFPATVAPPPDEVLDRVAGFYRLTGGGIKNCIVDATFRALDAKRCDDQGRPQVTEEDLVLAIAREYQKLGRPLTPEDFPDTHYSLVLERLLNPQLKKPIVATAKSNGAIG